MKIRFNKIIIEIDAETVTSELKRLAKAIAIANDDSLEEKTVMHIYAQLLAWQAHMVAEQKFSE